MKKRALVPLACCNYSLEVVEAAGFEPEMELCFSRHFVSATAWFFVIPVLSHLYGPLSHRITQDHGLVRTERDLWRSFSPTPLC